MNEPYTMRRADRAVTDPEKIDAIIRACQCCRLGLCDEGHAYIVPMSFGYERDGERQVFYFHAARKGRKLDLIAKTGHAAFELDTGYELHPNPEPSKCSAAYQSVMGEGAITMIEDDAEKRLALSALMEHTAGKANCVFPDDAVRGVCVLKLEVEWLSCKEHA